MEHAQNRPTGLTSRNDRALVDAMFAALTAASSFAVIGAVASSATDTRPVERAPRRPSDRRRSRQPVSFDPELHLVPRFTGWINH